MNDMAMDPLQPAAPVLDRLGSPGRGEDGPWERRQPPSPLARTPEPAADWEAAAHEADSLA